MPPRLMALYGAESDSDESRIHPRGGSTVTVRDLLQVCHRFRVETDFNLPRSV
jgi:hypothetical protein